LKNLCARRVFALHFLIFRGAAHGGRAATKG
jgi:hypothetical protein